MNHIIFAEVNFACHQDGQIENFKISKSSFAIYELYDSCFRIKHFSASVSFFLLKGGSSKLFF